MKPKGAPLVAVDNMQSGEGDIVAYVVGREATLILEKNFTPVDAGIVAIIDSVYTEAQP
jgi:microcompartment protein CcmK/EutM